MKYKISIVIGATVLAITEAIYIYKQSEKYVFLTSSLLPYMYVLLAVILVSIFSINVINDLSKAKRFGLANSLCYVVLLLVPLVFHTFKPEFTFKEAEDIIYMKENVQTIKNEIEQYIILSTKKELYLVTAKRDEKLEYYSFDPDTGEYYLLDREIKGNR